jgi:hypothetical protein
MKNGHLSGLLPATWAKREARKGGNAGFVPAGCGQEDGWSRDGDSARFTANVMIAGGTYVAASLHRIITVREARCCVSRTNAHSIVGRD